MQDCSAEGHSARSQVSGGAGVLLSAAGLDGGAEAEMVAALMVASPAHARGEATCSVASEYDSLALPGVCVLPNIP